VSAAITALPGIATVVYYAPADLFTVSFDPQRINVENVFAAVSMAGRRLGQEYLPQFVP